MRRASGSVSEARASFCSATSFGLWLGTLGFLRFDLGQFGACLFDPLLRLAQTTCPRRLGALGTRRLVRIDLGFQGDDTGLRGRLRLVQTQRALVRTLA